MHPRLKRFSLQRYLAEFVTPPRLGQTTTCFNVVIVASVLTILAVVGVVAYISATDTTDISYAGFFDPAQPPHEISKAALSLQPQSTNARLLAQNKSVQISFSPYTPFFNRSSCLSPDNVQFQGLYGFFYTASVTFGSFGENYFVNNAQDPTRFNMIISHAVDATNSFTFCNMNRTRICEYLGDTYYDGVTDQPYDWVYLTFTDTSDVLSITCGRRDNDTDVYYDSHYYDISLAEIFRHNLTSNVCVLNAISVTYDDANFTDICLDQLAQTDVPRFLLHSTETPAPVTVVSQTQAAVSLALMVLSVVLSRFTRRIDPHITQPPTPASPRTPRKVHRKQSRATKQWAGFLHPCYPQWRSHTTSTPFTLIVLTSVLLLFAAIAVAVSFAALDTITVTNLSFYDTAAHRSTQVALPTFSYTNGADIYAAGVVYSAVSFTPSPAVQFLGPESCLHPEIARFQSLSSFSHNAVVTADNSVLGFYVTAETTEGSSQFTWSYQVNLNESDIDPLISLDEILCSTNRTAVCEYAGDQYVINGTEATPQFVYNQYAKTSSILSVNCQSSLEQEQNIFSDIYLEGYGAHFHDYQMGPLDQLGYINSSCLFSRLEEKYREFNFTNVCMTSFSQLDTARFINEYTRRPTVFSVVLRAFSIAAVSVLILRAITTFLHPLLVDSHEFGASKMLSSAPSDVRRPLPAVAAIDSPFSSTAEDLELKSIGGPDQTTAPPETPSASASAPAPASAPARSACCGCWESVNQFVGNSFFFRVFFPLDLPDSYGLRRFDPREYTFLLLIFFVSVVTAVSGGVVYYISTSSTHTSSSMAFYDPEAASSVPVTRPIFAYSPSLAARPAPVTDEILVETLYFSPFYEFYNASSCYDDHSLAYADLSTMNSTNFLFIHWNYSEVLITTDFRDPTPLTALLRNTTAVDNDAFCGMNRSAICEFAGDVYVPDPSTPWNFSAYYFQSSRLTINCAPPSDEAPFGFHRHNVLVPDLVRRGLLDAPCFYETITSQYSAFNFTEFCASVLAPTDLPRFLTTYKKPLSRSQSISQAAAAVTLAYLAAKFIAIAAYPWLKPSIYAETTHVDDHSNDVAV